MIRLHPTLSLYLARRFLAGTAFVFFVIMVLVFLVDSIELLRRSGDDVAIDFALIVQLAVLRLPMLSQKLLPFAALFGGILTFSRLTRSNELIVVRAAGISVWQFLAPPLAVALVVGLLQVGLFNPLASVMTARYEHLEAKHLKGNSSLLAFSSTGIWLRQSDGFGQSVVHALAVAQEGRELREAIIFLYEGADRFVGRIDAATATLEDGYWNLRDGIITRPDGGMERFDEHRLSTSLTLEQIQEGFASPATLSFWSLPRFIDTLEEAGFAAVRHRLHWHGVLAQPALMCAMVLLAATVSLRLTRSGHTGSLIAVGVLAAFLLYFVSDVVFALGLSGNLPVILAAWAPATVSLLIGLALLFHFKDG